MKCPLFTIGYLANPEVLRGDAEDCYEAECAWWDDGQPGCSILTIAKELATKRQKEEIQE